MTIVSKTQKVERRIEIDLTGPEGNAFVLMAIANNLAKTLNKRRGAQYFDEKAIIEEMKSGDYENLIQVMEKYFGKFIIIYR